MRQICGVSLIFVAAFFVVVLFFSIVILAFFLPDFEAESVDARAISIGRADTSTSRDVTAPGSHATNFSHSTKHVVRQLEALNIVWDFGACGCTGWGIEAVAFALPLSRQLPHFGIVSGPDCFCPGLDSNERKALQMMRTAAEAMAELSRPPRAHQVQQEAHHDGRLVFLPRKRAHRSVLVLRTERPMSLASNPLDAAVARVESSTSSDESEDTGTDDASDDGATKAPARRLLSVKAMFTALRRRLIGNASFSDDGHSFFRLLRPKPEEPHEPLPPWEPTLVDIWVSHKPPQRFPHWPYHGILQFEQKPRYIIGRSMTEVDRISDTWIRALPLVDELWVPSEHSRNAFEAAGAQNVYIVPEAVDTQTLAPHLHARLVAHSSAAALLQKSAAAFPWHALRPCAPTDFIFLSVFKWEWRKGWDVLLRAYFSEFSRARAGPDSSDSEFDPNADNRAEAEAPRVCLVLKTHLFGEQDAHNAALIRSRVERFALRELKLERTRLPRFAVVSEDLSSSSMAALYRQAHAFVLPTRGEGWCLPALEAMAAGTPVVITSWSGHMDFARGRAHLVRVARMVEARGVDFERGSKWAEPDGGHLRLMMRNLRGGLEINSTHSEHVRLELDAQVALRGASLKQWRWRYQRLAPGVRRLALRAQQEVIALYNRESVAAHAMRRLRAIAAGLPAL